MNLVYRSLLLLLPSLMVSNIPAAQNLVGNTSKPTNDTLIHSLLRAHPDRFKAILDNMQQYRVQVIYTQIDRKKKGQPKFRDHFFNTDSAGYFYPASTVKLPVAILALQKLNELAIPGLDMNTTMITGAEGNIQTSVSNDPTAPDGRPTIAHYIRKILLVSDNDAFNRLYEFLGQEYINTRLHQMGFPDVQIIHRLSISLSDQQNRHTNPITFVDSMGNVIFEKPASISHLVYDTQDIKIGKGYIKGGTKIDEPFDFSFKNRMSLNTLHQVVRSIIFPESLPAERRFGLREQDYVFLRRYMSMRPSESDHPTYNEEEFWDNYVKMILYGVEKTQPDPDIRIFNKCGWSYGFLTDAAYVADLRNNIEFMVSAVIYCNSDGILNDDKYDYKEIGYPFLKNLGQTIYEYEMKRKRKRLPDLGIYRSLYLLK